MRLLSDEECRQEVDPLLLAVFNTVDLEQHPGFAEGAARERGFVIDGLEMPFTEAVTQRTVFQAVPALSEEQCRALCAAARNAGDAGLYVYNPARWQTFDKETGAEFRAAMREAAKAGTRAALLAVQQRFAERGTWLPWWPARFFPIASDDEVEAFLGWYFGSDNHLALRPSHILLSASGRWGMFVTDDDHTLLGATGAAPHFLADYCAALATTPEALAAEYVQDYEVSEWRRARRLGVNPTYTWVPTLLVHLFGPAEAARLLTEPTDDDTGAVAEARTRDSQEQHIADCRYCRLVADETAPGRVHAGPFGITTLDPRDVHPRRLLLLPRRHALVLQANLQDVAEVPAGALALGQQAADHLLAAWMQLYSVIKAAFPDLEPFGGKWDGENSEMRDTHAHYYYVLPGPGESALAPRPGWFMEAYQQDGPEIPVEEQQEIAGRLRAALAVRRP